MSGGVSGGIGGSGRANGRKFHFNGHDPEMGVDRDVRGVSCGIGLQEGVHEPREYNGQQKWPVAIM